MKETALQLLKQLVEAPCVSGNENEIARRIQAIAEPYVQDCWRDALGNLIVHRKGKGKKLMLAAHMDSIGLMVTTIEKEGFLRFGAVGGILPEDIIGQPVRFQNGLRGVVFCEEKADRKSLTLQDLFLDIGARDKAHAEELVQVGDTAVFASETYFAGDRLVSPYLDNRLGVLVLLLALQRLEQETEQDLYFVFTVQEEVGTRGAKTAGYQLLPDLAYAVDVTDIGDLPGGKIYSSVKLGAGAAVKVMDRSVVCHPRAVALLEDLAKEKKISVQREVLQLGGTDAGAIHTSQGGVVTGGISIPTRYIHTPAEMADWSDIEACVDLVEALCRSEGLQ